ncbi:MAG: AAA family ATPase [Chlorobiota bacterium]|nr:AAA family ATPase [Chlorobiota bacterium]QQS66326.1 MAG: AAA family ATPase [Chlorobiota bacterium]
MSDSKIVLQKRLEEIEFELSILYEDRNQLQLQWHLEKDLIAETRDLKNQIESLRFEAENFERLGELGKVAEIRYGTILETQKQLEITQKKLIEAQSNQQLLKEEVGADDIAEVVAKWTGIPVSRMLESERTKLIKMEGRLHERVIGQDEAVTAVSNSIRRSRAGLQDQNRPIGSFIFLGTTGVGKTELARSLADFLFDDENALIRIDMSEYMEKFSVSRLIGSPPGYVGYEEGGQLTEPVRRKPYSVVLLDEIEKAHPEVFNILLQVLDEGRLTDSKGTLVSFKNTIIIMTSNIGSDILQSNLNNAKTPEEVDQALMTSRLKLIELLRKQMRPEFLNRIDDIIVFKPLTQIEIRQIVNVQLKKTEEMLQSNRIGFEITDDAKDWIAKLGFDITYGARPLKRVIQKHILNPLSISMLDGTYFAGDIIKISLDNSGHFKFSK